MLKKLIILILAVAALLLPGAAAARTVTKTFRIYNGNTKTHTKVFYHVLTYRHVISKIKKLAGLYGITVKTYGINPDAVAEKCAFAERQIQYRLDQREFMGQYSSEWVVAMNNMITNFNSEDKCRSGSDLLNKVPVDTILAYVSSLVISGTGVVYPSLGASVVNGTVWLYPIPKGFNAAQFTPIRIPNSKTGVTHQYLSSPLFYVSGGKGHMGQFNLAAAVAAQKAAQQQKESERNSSIYSLALSDFKNLSFISQGQGKKQTQSFLGLSFAAKQGLVFNIIDSQMYSSIVSQGGGAIAATYQWLMTPSGFKTVQTVDGTGQKQTAFLTEYLRATTTLKADMSSIQTRLAVKPWVNQQIYNYYGNNLATRFGSLSTSRLKILTGGGNVAGLKNDITYAKILRNFDSFLSGIPDSAENVGKIDDILGTRIQAEGGMRKNAVPETFQVLGHSFSFYTTVPAQPQLYNEIHTLAQYPVVDTKSINFYSVTSGLIQKMYAGTLSRRGREILINVVNGNYRAAYAALNSIHVSHEQVSQPSIYNNLVGPYLTVLKSGKWKTARKMIKAVDKSWVALIHKAEAERKPGAECINKVSKVDPLMKTLLFFNIAKAAGNTPWSQTAKKQSYADMLKSWTEYKSWQENNGSFSECTGIPAYSQGGIANMFQNQLNSQMP